MFSFIERVKYGFSHPPFIWCSSKEWKQRQKIIQNLKSAEYRIEEAPNPLRLNAFKDGEEFIIDIDAWFERYGGILHIPSNNHNKNSKYFGEIKKIISNDMGIFRE